MGVSSARKPSARRAAGSAVKRLVAVPTACGLLLAVQLATARADDLQPPVTPPVPSGAVQVTVGTPSVSLSVQGGNIDVSVPGVSVSVHGGSIDVSVPGAAVNASSSVPSQSPPSRGDAHARTAHQPPTQNDGSSMAGAKQVAPTSTSAGKTRVVNAAPPKRLARPKIRPAASGVRTHTIRVSAVVRSTRFLAAKPVPRRTSEPPAIRPRAGRGCCENEQPTVAPAGAPTTLGSRPVSEARPDGYVLAESRTTDRPKEHARNNRLVLQLGLLGAFLYLTALAAWFCATRLRRGRA